MNTRGRRCIARPTPLVSVLLLLLLTRSSLAQAVRPSNESFGVDLGPAPPGTLLLLPSILQPVPPPPPSELQAWPDSGNSAFGAAYWLGWIDYDVQNTGFSIYRRAANEVFSPDLRSSRLGESIHVYGELT